MLKYKKYKKYKNELYQFSTNIKLRTAQISKITQYGGYFGCWLGNLGKKALTNSAIPFTRDNLPGLLSNAINKFERNISGKGDV